MDRINPLVNATVIAKRTALITATGAIWCGFALLLWMGHAHAADQTAADDLQIDAKSFRCITKMTRVRQFYVDNLRGNLEQTLAAANSTTGAVYPPGSVIQLVPTEVMVKRNKGFNTMTRDWEFFELDVSKDGTQIRMRGFADVVNRFGGNCFGCHVAARPEWDLVCEADHGLCADPGDARHDRCPATNRSPLR
jgi:hypothetical protein